MCSSDLEPAPGREHKLWGSPMCPPAAHSWQSPAWRQPQGAAGLPVPVCDCPRDAGQLVGSPAASPALPCPPAASHVKAQLRAQGADGCRSAVMVSIVAAGRGGWTAACKRCESRAGRAHRQAAVGEKGLERTLGRGVQRAMPGRGGHELSGKFKGGDCQPLEFLGGFEQRSSCKRELLAGTPLGRRRVLA